MLGQAFGTRLHLRITLLEMAFGNGLCKLSITDIDESEIILSHRQRLIEEKLLKCYTDEVASEICKLVIAELQRVSYRPSKLKAIRLPYDGSRRKYLRVL